MTSPYDNTYWIYKDHPVKNSYEFLPPLQRRGIKKLIEEFYCPFINLKLRQAQLDIARNQAFSIRGVTLSLSKCLL